MWNRYCMVNKIVWGWNKPPTDYLLFTFDLLMAQDRRGNLLDEDN